MTETGQDAVSRAAAGWVARLSSADATQADRLAFRRWCEQDPAHAAAYDELALLWSDLRDVPVGPGRLDRLRRGSTVRRTALAGVLLALIGAGLWHSGQFDRWRADYYTVTGEIRPLVLADGSRVILNTDSAIVTDVAPDGTDSARQVRLLRGEAWFDVAPDADRPFTVGGGHITTHVLGTGFAVARAVAGQPERVIVGHGRVAVSSGEERAELGADMMAILADDGGLVISARQASEILAWRSGRYEFSRRPLDEVLAQIGRYRTRHIIVSDEAARLLVSGIIDLNDTDQALRELANTTPIHLRRLSDLLIVVSLR